MQAEMIDHLTQVLTAAEIETAAGHVGAGENQRDVAWEIGKIKFIAREGWATDYWRIGQHVVVPGQMGDEFCDAAQGLMDDLQEAHKAGRVKVTLDLSADEYQQFAQGL